MATRALHGAAIRRVMSLTSWFHHPDIEMEGLEVLSKASACIIPASAGCAMKYHVLAAAHVTHPYKFPQYYPVNTHAFVHVLSEEHIKCVAELRNERNGELLVTSPLRNRSFTHPTRDLSVLHFEDEGDIFQKAMELGIHLEALQLATERASLSQKLSFAGHVLKDVQGQADAQDLVPFGTDGSVIGRSTAQVFAKTASVLQNGMCGGPALQADDLRVCYGVVEGVVPAAPEDAPANKGRDLLTGSTVFVEADDILTFIKQVERLLER